MDKKKDTPAEVETVTVTMAPSTMLTMKSTMATDSGLLRGRTTSSVNTAT